MWKLVALAAAGAAAAMLALGAFALETAISAGGAEATDARARTYAVEFFRSQNKRRYDDTCRLLSRGFYRAHGLRDRQTCAAVLRAAFVWSEKIRFRIGRITREGDRVVVRAVADGAPGRIVFVREDGDLRILAVVGG